MPPRALEFVCAAVLVIGCLVGGSAAPGRTLVAVPQLLSLILLALTALSPEGAGRAARARWLWAGVILILPLLQLVPLPPALWTALPGRAPVAENLAAAGVASPWLPLSLTPEATWRFWLALLPPLSLFLAVPALDGAAQRRLVHIAVAVGLASVTLGLAQLAGGATSPLRVYDGASRVDAVGLFANRNHQAAFLAVLVALAGALATGAGPAERAERVWLAAAGALLLVGVAASGSRAGLALGAAAAIAVGWIVLRDRPAGGRRRSALAIGAVAALPLLAGLAIFGGALLRARAETLSDDLRWRIAGVAWRTLVDLFPAGGGFGGFERLYARAEGAQDVTPEIVNNAHNDWLELVIEGGLPALVLLVVALVVLVRATVAADRQPDRPAPERAIRTAALAALWLCAAHSLVDYPLRTIAVALVFALACGLRAGRAEPAVADGAGRGAPSRRGQ